VNNQRCCFSSPKGIVRAALRCPVLHRTGLPRVSCRFGRFPVDVEEFEPEVPDSLQQAVQGRLVGPGTPQHRRIAHHAHLRVVEERPHPWTRGTADGDHVSAVGYSSRLRHSCREPPDGVSCPHPFPTGLPFNSVMAIELNADRTMNPLVNAGAIATTSLVPGTTAEEKFESIVAAMSRFAGRRLVMDEEVYESEAATNDRNRGIAHLLDGYAHMYCDPDLATEVYTRQCSVRVSARDLWARSPRRSIWQATACADNTSPGTSQKRWGSTSLPRLLLPEPPRMQPPEPGACVLYRAFGGGVGQNGRSWSPPLLTIP